MVANSTDGDKTQLTTGCPNLDAFLGGGLTIRGVTEVSGQSGSGKTQFGLQLALYAQLPRSLGGLAKGMFQLFKLQHFFTKPPCTVLIYDNLQSTYY